MNSESQISGLDGLRAIAVGSFWTAMGYGARYVLGALASIVVARLLGAESFGEYGMLTSTVALVSIAADLGMGVTAARFVGAYRTSDPARANRALSMSVQVMILMALVLGTALVLAAPSIATRWLSNSDLAGPLRASTLAIMFTAAGSTILGGLRGLGLFKQMAAAETGLAVAAALLMIGGAWVGRLEGAITGFIGGSALRAVGYGVPLVRYSRSLGWRLWRSDAWQEAPAILRFSVPAFASGFVVTPALWVVRVLLANSPEGYRQVGAFTAALQWQTPLTFLAVVIGTVLLPSMSAQFEKGDRAKLVTTFRASFLVLSALELAACILLVSSSGVLATAYGNSYTRLETTLSLVIAASFFNAVLSIPGQVLAAMNRMWVGLMLNMVWASVFLISSLVAVGRLGAAGAAASYLVAYLIHAVTSTVVAVALLGVPITTILPVLGTSSIALGAVAWWRIGSGGTPFLLVGLVAATYVMVATWNTIGRSLAHELWAAIGGKRKRHTVDDAP